MENRIRVMAEHFLNVTQYIFQHRGFCFSTAFLVGDQPEVIKLDLSTEERKMAYARMVKKRFHELQARQLIVILPACLTKLSAEDMQAVEPDRWPSVRSDGENTSEGLIAFISSRKEGEVWHVPFRRTEQGLAFGEREVMPAIVSENWMVNPNRHLALAVN